MNKRKVQKMPDGWSRSVSSFMRVVQKPAGIDEDGHRLFDYEDVPVTMIREDYGRTSVFGASEDVIAGLKRVHIYAA